MAAINKNFAIKNGIEVGGNLIFGDKDKLRVGVGTTEPNYTLDVRGGIGATFVSVGQSITASTGSISSFRSTNLTVGGELNFQSGVGTGLNVSGIGTVGSLSIGSTEVIDSSRQLKNISSLDATTTATIEAAIASGPNTFTDLIVSGIATFNSDVGVAGIVTAPAISATWAQVGSGLTFTTGIGTNLSISGIATVTAVDATEISVTAFKSTWAQVGSGLTFTTGIGTNLSISGVATVTTVDATEIYSTWVQVGSGLTFTTGIGTNLSISGIASVGSGITLTSSGDAQYAGIITAYKFVGDGSALTGTISGVGINSDGVTIGTGVTFINFTGPGVSTVTVSVGIATIIFEGGGGGATIDKQSFNVGAAGTNLLTLTNSYTTGNVDVYLNGLKLSPGDFSETSSNTIGLTTEAVFGDTIDVVSFRAVGDIVGQLNVQQDSVGIGTSVFTLNFVGGAATYVNNNNGILDIYLAQGKINKQTFNVGAGGTNLLTLSQPYESGKVDIYRNGIRLASGDFTELTATTIGLTTTANNGDVVEVQSFIGQLNTSNLSIVDNLKVNNIATSTKLHVGIATTFSETLVVSGNARITGILTIGTGTITLDGSNNTVNIGTGVTITSAGQIQATSLSIGGAPAVTSPGVGIATVGGTVGTGVTLIDLRGAGISTVTVSSGIATINITGGGGGTGSQLSISTTAPVSPTDGQQWFDNSDGNTYIWYASQNVWVVSQTYGY